MVLNFEKEKLVTELKKLKPKKVLVQLPEGIKQNASEIAEIIENLNIEVVFSGETAWGGCCISPQEAKNVGADLIVHFGHAKFIDIDFPILYMEVKDELNLHPLLQKSIKHLKNFKKIGISYSIQHKHDIDKIIRFYENEEKKVILSGKKGRVKYEGHIVGCQYSGLKAIEKDVDCFVIIGNQFHSMGAAISVEKPVVLVDVYNDKIRDMDGVREKILKQRAISIQKLKDARNVGIIQEEKLGQQFGTSEYLVDKLKEQDKNVILITMNELTPDKLMNFYNIDCFIVLACPRIPIDDFAKYEKPMVTFKEALVALGMKSWDEILKIGII
ncbi:diphthamide biosynthesis enzyme Dph2 [Candidatus Woesearchaeota archaeon B3_Woes]|nr:MAG: diphthamide biosynthesis enzyme Dph2 [Candidatus Woesearchaeota archaeon B3_Woes]